MEKKEGKWREGKNGLEELNLVIFERWEVEARVRREDGK